uniref:Transposase domain-containing protein n=1 Tax=Tribolium castaneum TaxID=7070 RepID=A0JPR4_TRICA|nr:TPA: transposase domain-containing protein [Tribolium castaneum]
MQVSFNIDGIPLFNSSNKQFWPILCRVHLNQVKIKPFPVALFYGDSKPFSIFEYLNEFIKEINQLTSEGLQINEFRFEIRVMCITCDAPARSYVKGIKGHNAYFGCETCIQKGVNLNRRIIYIETNSHPRTHQNFVSKEYPAHHLFDTPLKNMLNIDLIKQVTLDYMHLCCLGVMRKLLNYWYKGGNMEAVRLSVSLRLRLSN